MRFDAVVGRRSAVVSGGSRRWFVELFDGGRRVARDGVYVSRRAAVDSARRWCGLGVQDG